MKIIIVGCGKVGYAIARQMEQESMTSLWWTTRSPI